MARIPCARARPPAAGRATGPVPWPGTSAGAVAAIPSCPGRRSAPANPAPAAAAPIGLEQAIHGRLVTDAQAGCRLAIPDRRPSACRRGCTWSTARDKRPAGGAEDLRHHVPGRLQARWARPTGRRNRCRSRRTHFVQLGRRRPRRASAGRRCRGARRRTPQGKVAQGSLVAGVAGDRPLHGLGRIRRARHRSLEVVGSGPELGALLLGEFFLRVVTVSSLAIGQWAAQGEGPICG